MVSAATPLVNIHWKAVEPGVVLWREQALVGIWNQVTGDTNVIKMAVFRLDSPTSNAEASDR
jgi:hypothetical protein